ncbi:hypothetical protein SDC9_168950 [bioreactor metagenome]|uniref:Uncharacterized protein n=1 Tax=bioreactor metagenome TaxID=1076179 RepID=A0A645G6H9_9ZZZZ
MIEAAAELAAQAAVARRLLREFRQQATSREAYAERAVNENLQLDRRFRRDSAQFLQSKLAFENHPFDAEFRRFPDAGGVMDAHLSRGMDRQLRKVAAQQVENAEILYDHRIRFEARQFGEGGHRFRQFGLGHQRVESHIHLAPELAGMVDQPREVVRREVFRPVAGVEFVQPQIDRVRARAQRRHRGFEIARGGQEFGPEDFDGFL